MDDRDLRAIEECRGLLDDVRGLIRLAAFEEEFSERAIYTHLAMQKVNHVDNLLKRVSETEEESHDRECGPSHHYNFGTIETIDVIEDWNLGFNLRNAVKYIARCDHKGSSIEDLEKAAWYLHHEIELRKKRKGAASYSDGKSEGN